MPYIEEKSLFLKSRYITHSLATQKKIQDTIKASLLLELVLVCMSTFNIRGHRPISFKNILQYLWKMILSSNPFSALEDLDETDLQEQRNL